MVVPGPTSVHQPQPLLVDGQQLGKADKIV